MVATAIQENISYPLYGHQTRKISWEEFEKKYLSREDNFKYEWVDGIVEKTPRTMNQNQYYILDNIEDFLNSLKAQNKASGKFQTEIDTFFLDKVHRRPDSAYFSDAQRKLMAQSINQIPNLSSKLFLLKTKSTLFIEKCRITEMLTLMWFGIYSHYYKRYTFITILL
jgi:Uma2 family endonuclease